MPQALSQEKSSRRFIKQLSLAFITLRLPLNLKAMTNPPGIIIKTSSLSVTTAVAHLVEIIKRRGAKIYTIIDQQQELSQAGITIPPMQFMMFGNPAAGGRILKEVPLAGLDLPLKILVWEDGTGAVYIACNAHGYLKDRYNLTSEQSQLLDLERLVSAVTSI